MAAPFIQTSFAAGEIAPHVFGRTDLQKYMSGTAMMRNFFVDYRGGASTRPGTSFVGVVDSSSAAPRIIPFEFNTAQTYQIVISASGLMSFVSEGAFVVNTALAITEVSTANGLQVTIPGSAYAVGNLIYITGVIGLLRANGASGINGRTLLVTAVDGDIVTLVDPISGTTTAPTWAPYISGGTAASRYSIPHPWASADFQALNFTQSADVLTIVHPNYPPYTLNRYGATDWTITAITIGTAQLPPTGGTAKGTYGTYPSGVTAPTQDFTYGYQVTAVSAGGEESQPITISCTNIALNQTYGTVNNLMWVAPAEGAASYNLYKGTPFPVGSDSATFYGLIGQSLLPGFCDNNFEADFSTVPPTHQSPFTNIGPITTATIGQTGFGYLSPVATIGNAPGATPAGSGATMTLTTNAAGGISTYDITAGGTNYSAPTIVVSEGNTALGTSLALAFSGAVTAGDGGYIPAPGAVTISAAGAGYHIAYITAAFGTDPVSNGAALGLIQNGVVTTIEWLSNPVTSASAVNTLAFTITDLLPGDARAPGSGAQMSVQPEGGGGPGVAAYFQQRMVYAASNGAPDTFWMSKPGDYANFDTSMPSQPDDSLVGTLVSSQVNAINSLTAMTGGLIALTENGAYLINGGTVGAALDPSTIQAQTQAFSGASPLPPLRINYDLLYEQARGSGIRDLEWNFYVNIYTGSLVSALSSHLFDGHTLKQWDYAEEPYYVVWAVRDDGALLSLTYLKEQQIFGWARHDTYGRYAGVAVVPEGNADVPYFVVQRPLGDSWVYVIERQATRFYESDNAWNEPTNPEAPWCVDAGASTAASASLYPNANLTVQAAVLGTASLTFNVDQPVFVAPIAVGNILRAAGGIGTITDIVSDQQIVVSMYQQMTSWVSNNASGMAVVPPQPYEDWSITAPFTVASGLDHLDGQKVSIVADGSVVTPQTVVDGCITLPQAASVVTAGLGFTCQLQTLRLDAGQPTVATRRKTIPAVTIRSNETRGLMVGATWDHLFELKQREFEAMGSPMGYDTGGGVQPPQIPGGATAQVPWYQRDIRTVLEEKWGVDGQYCIQQSYPLPATVLASIPEVSIGDQPSA